MNNNGKNPFSTFGILLVAFFFAAYIGVACHALYVGHFKRQIWLEAVERGYAEEVETSEGKAFIWKNSEYEVDTWTIGMKNES